MKLLSYKIKNRSKLGFYINDRIIGISDSLRELKKDNSKHANLIFLKKSYPNTILELLKSGKKNIEQLKRLNSYIKKKIDDFSNLFYKENEIEFLPPIPNPPIVCGLVGNCAQFWRKQEGIIAKYPIGFIRPATSLAAHNQKVTLTDFCTSFRFAVELGIIISKDCKNISEEEVMDHVAGYTCVNDMVTDKWKDHVMENSPSKNPSFYEYLATSYYGRGTDGFAPCGPYLVTKDEVSDPYNLLCHARLSRKAVDRSYSSSLVVGIENAISFISQYMTIPTGSIIHMGTMGTDGYTIAHDNYLNQNDYLEIEIEKIGRLRTYIIDKRNKI